MRRGRGARTSSTLNPLVLAVQRTTLDRLVTPRTEPDLSNRNGPDDRGEMTEAADIHTWDGPTMDVAHQDLARRRGRRPRPRHLRARGARVGVPARRARHHQGPPRRDARVPQELPDDDLRLLRDAHGRPRGPRLQGADEADRRERPRPGHLADGEHADRQGPRRRHGPVLAEDPRRQALARPGLRRGDGARTGRLPAADERHPEGGALHHVRLLRLRVQRDGVGPRIPRAGRAREGDALRRRRPRPDDRRAPERATTTSTGSGTAPGATSATSGARRASTRATRSPSSAPSR